MSDINISGIGQVVNGDGIYLLNGSYNVLQNLTLTSNAGSGIKIGDADDNFFTNLTVVNNGGEGIYATNGTTEIFHNTVIANSGLNGLKWQTAGGDNGTFSNFISTNNLSNGIYFDNGVYDHKFTGVLGVGNNTGVDCEMSHASQGLIDLNCTSTGADGSTSYPGETTAGSNAILRPSRNLSNAFVGKAPSDAIIPIDTSGTASFTSINADFLYWVGFENPFRAWGKFHADAPLTANHRGHCVTGQTCQIWDYSAVSGQPIYNVSGNGSSTNSAFVADAACPSVLNGNNALVSRMGTYTYLAAAVEILGDKQGNENGLCESNENCLYTPHFGSYQGSGAPNKCTFNNGTVTNVKMFGLSSL